MTIARLAALTAAFVATPVVAQENSASPPPTLAYAPVYEDAPADVFAGPRMQVHGGWDHVGLRIKARAVATDGTVTTGSAKAVDDGVVYGGSLGWDIAITRTLTFGVEAGIEESSIRGCLVDDGITSLCLKAGRALEVGARIGQALDSRTLFYVRAAYMNARVTERYVDRSDPTQNVSGRGNVDGVRFGVGLQAALSPNLYLATEYRYTDYRNQRATAESNTGERGTADLSIDRHQIVGGVGLRF